MISFLTALIPDTFSRRDRLFISVAGFAGLLALPGALILNMAGLSQMAVLIVIYGILMGFFVVLRLLRPPRDPSTLLYHLSFALTTVATTNGGLKTGCHMSPVPVAQIALVCFATALLGDSGGLVWVLISMGCIGLLSLDSVCSRSGDSPPVEHLNAYVLCSCLFSVYHVTRVFANLAEEHDSTLRRKESEKARMIGVLSHELRAPLHSFQGVLSKIAADNHRGPMRLEREDFQDLMRCSHDMVVHLDNVLAMLRSEHQEGKMEPFHLMDDLLTASLERDAHLRIETQIGDVPQLLVGDVGRIREVLVNYLSNARKAAEDSSVVIRVSRNEYLPPAPTHDWLCFSVVDEGCGIDEEDRDILFQAFSQGRRLRRGGTGLGLFICKHLAQSMGGSVGLASERSQQRGATFYLAVPLVEAPVPQRPTRAMSTVALTRTQARRLQQLKIMVVDDADLNRKVSLRMLQRLGAKHLDSAENGLLALEKAVRTHYDVIFTDLDMPVMSGLESCKRMRESDVTSIIIAITGQGDLGGSLSSECRECGMDAFLLKPFQTKGIVQALLDTDALG